MLVYIFTFSIFLIVYLFFILLSKTLVGEKTSIKLRLKTVGEAHAYEDDEPLNLPFKVRIYEPLQEKIIYYINRLLPANLKDSLEKKLVQCGNPRGMKANMFLTGLTIAAFLLAVVWFAVTLVLGLGFVKAFLGALVAIGVAILASIGWLFYTADIRIKSIDRSLPDAIDLLVVSVEAGLGFDLAMAKVTERIKGPLGEEFSRALNEIKMGKNRQAALKDLSKRVNSENLRSFLSMVIQGTSMGFAIGPILRIQSDTMRTVRRQKAEEMAMKAPIKMVFPLVLCIFPALFLVIIGPAMLKIIKAF
jgi:tight adherence protein C